MPGSRRPPAAIVSPAGRETPRGPPLAAPAGTRPRLPRPAAPRGAPAAPGTPCPHRAPAPRGLLPPPPNSFWSQFPQCHLTGRGAARWARLGAVSVTRRKPRLEPLGSPPRSHPCSPASNFPKKTLKHERRQNPRHRAEGAEQGSRSRTCGTLGTATSSDHSARQLAALVPGSLQGKEAPAAPESSSRDTGRNQSPSSPHGTAAPVRPPPQQDHRPPQRGDPEEKVVKHRKPLLV